MDHPGNNYFYRHHPALYLMLNTLALLPSRRSFVFSQLAAHAKGPILVIVNELGEKPQLLEELRFFDTPVHDFLDWETLPYDPFSPHIDIISERLRLLSTLPHLQNGVVLVGARTLLAPLPPPSFIKQHLFRIKLEDTLNLGEERSALIAAGYRQVDQVFARGEYSVRGSIFDIFPMGAHTPYRIDLFDKTVDSIRDFDPETQRSSKKLNRIELLPTHEFPLDKEAVAQFKKRLEAHFPAPPFFASLEKGVAIQGLEYYLPLFFDKKASLFDYCPLETTLIFDEQLESIWAETEQEIKARYQEKQYDRDRPPLPPKTLFFSKESLFTEMKAFAQIECVKTLKKQGPTRQKDCGIALPQFDLSTEAGKLILQDFVKAHAGYEIFFTAETQGRVQLLREQLSAAKIIEAPLQQGWIDPERKLIYIPEPALFPHKVFTRLNRKTKPEQDSAFEGFNDFSELNVGDIVVHIHHGIGRYTGLSTLSLTNNAPQEFLTVVYENDDKLYVPIHDLSLLSRYSLGTSSVALHTLGSDRWQKSKEKAAKRITDIAAELLQLYAERMSKPGHAYTLSQQDYQLFCDEFPYEETEDQLKAIDDVIRDMTSPHPMDRLLCGDVGFGKTEVAMRAAFVAVQNGKQVVILVPTTLLAEQHYENFINRFAKWPIKIAHFSRFTSTAQEVKARAGLENGKVDIVIATHKILRDAPSFKDLGLMIIDEEHRFGVKDKERLKAFRSNVDILTMTATPIPRTLNFSLSMLRDLSLIATPPAKRLSVKTFVKEYSTSLIKEALLREVLRGGQVYYLHNDVASIEATRDTLQTLLPQLSFAIAHGQMRQSELERVMADFYHNRSQVLICSTIIETGLDIPNANTILIERADRFGLAQLHQLRGRVGRSHHQAYAYLLAPPKASLTTDAKKRLEALEKSTELGSGFTLASHDLEIRGAGEILGEGQSGHMQEIGFSLYHELLDRAIASLKKGQKLQYQDLLIDPSVTVELNVPRLFPEDYISDVHTRLQLYQRLQKVKSEEALLDFKIEVIDRFGPLPPPALFLIESEALKLKAKALGFTRIEAHATQAKLALSSHPHFDPMKLIRLIQTHSDSLQLRGQEALIIKKTMPKAEDRFKAIDCIFEKLIL